MENQKAVKLVKIFVLTCMVLLIVGFSRQGEAIEPTNKLFSATSSAFFPMGSIWSTDISLYPLDVESAQTIRWMTENGNWGGGHLGWWPHDFLRISTEWRVLYSDRSTPFVPLQMAPGYYLPSCDDDLTHFPLPIGGSIQGGQGYNDCAATGGDCHLIVYDKLNQKLYESIQTSFINGVLTSGCAIVWDTSKIYPPQGRGDQCTSTDGAGLPSGALIFSADDLAAGHIDHAIRLTLPNSMIRQGMFVHPATHATGTPFGSSAVSGGASAPSPAPIYGARLRLKADFDITNYSPAIQVILKAMKTYGVIVSDGGDICITAANDEHTVHKYSEFNLDLDKGISFLNPSHFDVIDGGERIPLTYDCVREPKPTRTGTSIEI